jgi:hypothetical protein
MQKQSGEQREARLIMLQDQPDEAAANE